MAQPSAAKSSVKVVLQLYGTSVVNFSYKTLIASSDFVLGDNRMATLTEVLGYITFLD